MSGKIGRSGRPKGSRAPRWAESGPLLTALIEARGYADREAFVDAMYAADPDGEGLSALRNRVRVWETEGLIARKGHKAMRIVAFIFPGESPEVLASVMEWLKRSGPPPQCVVAVGPLHVRPLVNNPAAPPVGPAQPVTRAVLEERLLIDVVADALADADDLEANPEKLAEITRRMRARAQATLRKTGSLRRDSNSGPHHYERRPSRLAILPSLREPRKAS